MRDSVEHEGGFVRTPYVPVYVMLPVSDKKTFYFSFVLNWLTDFQLDYDFPFSSK